ncbi:MAG: aminopeptidase P family protein [Anaerorhabdus sp.]
MKIKEKIKLLRQEMAKEGMDAYYIPTSDFHQSEYVAKYFKVREYMSGFTGSRGMMVVTQKEAVIWVDGRYFTQADKELKGSGIKALKMGQPQVPTLNQYLSDFFVDGGVLGFDGRIISVTDAAMLKTPGVKFKSKDLIDAIWTDRPRLPFGECFVMPAKYVGEKADKRIERVRTEMRENGHDVMVVSALEDVAWLLNLRGHDIENTPVFLSYVTISMKQVVLYVDKKKCSPAVMKYLKSIKVKVKPYNALQQDLKELKGISVVIEPQSLSMVHRGVIASSCKVSEKASVIRLYRAFKTNQELKSLRQAHIKDGAALTKFIHWVKTNVEKRQITEWDALVKLNEYRSKMDLFIEPSFTSITAAGANAAMMHYSASEQNHAVLEKRGFFLVDSGGQYFDGTTDVTRTIVLGKVSEKEKKYYTAVLRGMIRLSQANFLKGVSGADLDILARGPVWDLDLDYQCGTGHGVGFCLGVHEGPHGFRWGVYRTPLEEGMVITNEPGIYLPEEFGIRIENELIVQAKTKNFYGQFMNFETMTLAPIDLDAIIPSEMTKEELTFLNDYHEEVYKKISPFMTPKEKIWLKHETRKILK